METATVCSPIQILMVEDNPADVTLIRHALKQHDVECSLYAIRDGEEAIAFLRDLDENPNGRHLDIVLLDMHLPKIGGHDILAFLRSIERYAHTPVLAMTGSDSDQLREEALRFAPLSYFRKPLGLEEFMRLGAMVRDILHMGPNCDGRGSAEREEAGEA